MLAQRLPGILPPLPEEDALESAAIQSLTGRFRHEDWGRRPYRAPHHTASSVALVGGGSDPRPGEISLAHHGVLFLDELPEWDRKVLEVLREPLESGKIHISRAARQVTFPASFQFVAAMNPCPCGYLGHPSGKCRCTPDQIARYRGRISGPLMDRIDLQIEVPSLPADAPAREARRERKRGGIDCRSRARRASGRAPTRAAGQSEQPASNSRAGALVRARRRKRVAAQAGVRATIAFGACLPSNPESRTYHRRPCRRRCAVRKARRRGDQLSTPRSRVARRQAMRRRAFVARHLKPLKASPS